MTQGRAFVRHAACRLVIAALVAASVAVVVGWPSAGHDRAAAAVQPGSNGLPQPVGFWRLGKASGGGAAASAVDNGSGKHRLAGQNVTWCQVGHCAAFNGSDAAFLTSGPVVNTGGGSSFTVSAEVELNHLPASGRSATAVAQDGGKGGGSGFYLQWSGAKGCWAFARETNRSYGCTGRYTGTWTRLTGVYDGSNGQTTLYVDGKLAQSTTDTAPAASSGPLTIGRGMFGGKPTDWWDGSIRNVEVFGQPLTASQVQAIPALVAPKASQGAAPKASQGTAANASSPAPSASGTPAASGSPAASASGSAAASGSPAASSASGTSSALLWAVIGIVVLVAAAAVGFLLYRRRKEPAVRPAAPAPVGRSAAWTIDRALKALTTACDDQGIAFPGVYLVTVDAASIAVTVSKPSTRAPAGWTASSDGRTWSARLADLQASDVRDTGGKPFAGLVMLGTSEDGQVLLDLDQAGGPVSVDGPKGSVDEIIEMWVTELTANPWSGTVRVARVQARNEPNLESVDRLLADLYAGERALIVFEEPPSRSQTAALRDRLTSPLPAWILIKGSAPVATWRLTANRGLLSSGFLPDIRYSTSSADPRRSPLSPAGN